MDPMQPRDPEVSMFESKRPLPAAERDGFRHRGFSFRKKAGTTRTHLSKLMWQSHQDWLRLGTSCLVRQFPKLGPKPVPDDGRGYQYSPSVSDPDDFSFILVGDTGMNSPGQYLVSTAISHQTVYPSDFCLILGDVMYPAGGAEGYRYGLLEAFRHYKKPILAVPGNHDWYDQLEAYRRFFISGDIPSHLSSEYAWASPQLPNWYYYMDFGNALRVICLDTGISGELAQNQEAQLDWLDGLLETAGPRKVILVTHHPLYSLTQRPHERRLRQWLLPRLKKANVVAVFSGHDHSYQRHVVAGCHHVVQGAGGASLHPLPDSAIVVNPDGTRTVLQKQSAFWDKHYSFIHCQYRSGQLTCTTLSAHEVPGYRLDRFVL